LLALLPPLLALPLTFLPLLQARLPALLAPLSALLSTFLPLLQALLPPLLALLLALATHAISPLAVGCCVFA
jgi:hypothetical protein